MSITNLRRFPSDNDLLKMSSYKDILYATLQMLSQWNKEDDLRYVPLKGKQRITKTQMAKFANLTRQTVDSQLKALELGKFIIITEETIILPNISNKYFKIPYETLRYMSNTFRPNVIKVFTYLGRMWEWYIISGNSKEVVFSENNLLEIIGMTNTTPNNHLMIRDILLNLYNNGLIKYEKKITNRGNEIYLLTEMNTLIKNAGGIL
jgi:hypothetical protein